MIIYIYLSTQTRRSADGSMTTMTIVTFNKERSTCRMWFLCKMGKGHSMEVDDTSEIDGSAADRMK